MRNVLNFNSFNSLNEHVIFDYRKSNDNRGNIKYNFNVGDIKYTVDIFHDRQKHHFGTYEVVFGFDGQKHESDRTKKDLTHLNSVLNTVCEIVEVEVKEKKIEVIKIQGAVDVEDGRGILDNSLRSRLYLRFIKNRYGSDSSIVESVGRYINVNMKKVFPEIFSEDRNRIDLIVDELVKLSDISNNRDEIMNSVEGLNDQEFSISTDFIENKKVGGIYFEISSFESTKEFGISWEFLDEDGSGDEFFDNFEELILWIKVDMERIIEKI